MRLEKWTLLVESIGTLAIIVSLLFVAFEIRENTNATYAASYDALANSQIDWRMRIAANPEMREDWSEFLEGRFENIWSVRDDTTAYMGGALLLNYERAYFARQYGRLGEREWSRYQRSMCGASGALRELTLENNFTEEFWQYLKDCDVEPSRNPVENR
jgi:hypothetical protein